MLGILSLSPSQRLVLQMFESHSMGCGCMQFRFLQMSAKSLIPHLVVPQYMAPLGGAFWHLNRCEMI